MIADQPPVSLGFVGCGVVTERGHLPGLRSVPMARVAALSDIDENRLVRVADRFHVQRRYTDFRALIDDPAVDAVAVCVPAQFHVQVASEVLDAGKHLFIEKPLALSLDDCDLLIRRSAEAPGKTMVGFNLRWHRLIQDARSLIAAGALGTPELVRSILTSGTRYSHDVPAWRKERTAGGGEFLETAVHHLDLWRFLLETEIEETFAVSKSEQWDDESATIIARLGNGALATAVFSTVTSDAHALELYGRAGRLSISLLNFGGLDFSSVGGSRRAIRDALPGISRTVRTLPRRAIRARQGGDYVLSYANEWRHFIGAIQQGTSPECTLDDGRRALQAAFAAIESASRGGPVRVRNAVREVIATRRHAVAGSNS